MGLPIEIFVDKESVTRNYSCNICRDVLDAAVSCGCPEDHSFCRICLENWLGTTGRPSCPTCKARIDKDDVRPAKFVQRNINNEDTICPNAPDCAWRGSLLDHSAHVKACGFAPRQCSGCQTKLRQDALQEHEAQCDRVPRPCPNADLGCASEIPDAGREEHLATCRRQIKERLEKAEAEAKRERERADAEKRRADGCEYRATSAERRATFAEADAHRAKEAARAEAGERSDRFVSFSVTVPNFVQLSEREAQRRSEWSSTPEHSTPSHVPWRLSLYPGGDSRTDRSVDHLGVYLHSTDSGRPYRARFGYTLVNADNTKNVVVRVESAREFGSCGHGSSQFVRLATVTDPAEGFLFDGALRFFVWVWVEGPEASPPAPPPAAAPSRPLPRPLLALLYGAGLALALARADRLRPLLGTLRGAVLRASR